VEVSSSVLVGARWSDLMGKCRERGYIEQGRESGAVRKGSDCHKGAATRDRQAHLGRAEACSLLGVQRIIWNTNQSESNNSAPAADLFSS
jgi:hypothetical protein